MAKKNYLSIVYKGLATWSNIFSHFNVCLRALTVYVFYYATRDFGLYDHPEYYKYVVEPVLEFATWKFYKRWQISTVLTPIKVALDQSYTVKSVQMFFTIDQYQKYQKWYYYGHHFEGLNDQ